MSLKYDFYESPSPEGNSGLLHARVVTTGTTGTKQIAEFIQLACTVTVTDVTAVLQALTDTIVSELLSSRRVHLEGLGYFYLTLSCPAAVSAAKQVRARSVKVKSIVFRPEAGFKKRFITALLERAKNKNHSRRYTGKGIDKLLSGYFEQHDYITSREFQTLCGLTRSTAANRLKKLVDEGKLRKIGHPKSPLYISK